MRRLCYVYTLSDPETGEVKYVGATENPKRRFSQHTARVKVRARALDAWLTSLFDKNLLPEMKIIEVVGFYRAWQAERKWINRYREMGAELTNYQSHPELPYCFEQNFVELSTIIFKGKLTPEILREGIYSDRIDAIMVGDKVMVHVYFLNQLRRGVPLEKL